MDYTIKSGDTLGGLAKRFNTTVKKLADDNQIANPDLIIAGKTLHVPDAEQDKAADQPKKAETPAQTTQTAETQPAQQTQATQTVPATQEQPKATQDTAQVSQQAQNEIEQYHATDLEEVTKRVQEAQAKQVAEAPKTETAPTQTATVKTDEKPKTENPKKSWWDRLIDKGEDTVANTVGKIPLIGGLFKFQSQVTGGALKAVGDMVGGLFNVVAHPIQTLKGVWGLAAHIPFSPPNMLHVANEMLHGKGPSEIIQEEGTYLKGLWNGITGGYQDAIKEGKWGEIPGRLVVDVGSFLIGAGEANATVKGASVAGKVAETTKAVEVAADAGKAADALKAAEVAADAGKAADAAKAAEVAADAGKAADAAKAAEVAADASKAAEAAKAAEVASAAGKAGRIARAVEAFKATSVGKAVLDVGAGLQLMGDSVGDLGKALAKSLRESAGKIPATQLKEAENLAAQAEKLSKQLQEVSLLEGAEGATRMKQLLKDAQQLTEATEKVAKADKGLSGLATALRERAGLASEVFEKNGVIAKAADIGTVATETAKALADVGVQAVKAAGRGVGKLPGAVLDQATAFGKRAAALGERASSALGTTGEAATQIYKAMGTEARQLAAEARQLAKATGDAEYLQLAELYEAEASHMGQVVGVMSLGLPLNAAQGGQEAVGE